MALNFLPHLLEELSSSQYYNISKIFIFYELLLLRQCQQRDCWPAYS